MEVITTKEEWGQVLKRDDSDTIIIEGDLKNQVVRIKAVGKVAWGVAFGAIAVAVVAILASPANVGTSFIVSFIGGTAAVGVLGNGTAIPATSIAVAAGSVGALNSLRSFDILQLDDKRLVLKKR